MLDYDAHLHAFQVDLTEQASLDRINLAKEHWRAYVQGRAELQLSWTAIPISGSSKLSEAAPAAELVIARIGSLNQ